MRSFVMVLVLGLAVYACNSSERKAETVNTTDTSQIIEPGISVPGEAGNAKDEVNNNDTTAPVKDTVPSNDVPGLTMADKALLGRHSLTLQWISWDVPGMAVIEKGKDGWYTIKGRQENKSDYLLINGKLRPVFENTEDAVAELEFNGIIEYKVSSINAGQPCSKSGKQQFLSTKGRKYWRLQNMLNCDKTTTDYVDIYF